jgi:hypothetical protein
MQENILAQTHSFNLIWEKSSVTDQICYFIVRKINGNKIYAGRYRHEALIELRYYQDKEDTLRKSVLVVLTSHLIHGTDYYGLFRRIL